MRQTHTVRRPARRAYALLPAIALLAVLALAGAARAQQWTTSTNGADNISHANGNVGVGTQAPAYGLHVDGASTQTNNFIQGYFRNTNAALPYGGVGVDGQSQSHVRFLIGGTPKWQWRAVSATGVDDLRAYHWALGKDVLTMTKEGGVGIGTATPQSRLHVDGGMGIGTMRVSGKGMGVLNFEDTNALADKRIYQWRSEGGVFRMTQITDIGHDTHPNILVANSAGNVGVGVVPAPNSTYRLDVAGSARVSQDLSVAGAITGATISAAYQDVAEWVPSAQRLAAGTVVVLDTGKVNHVVASGSAYDTKVAGVVSAEPGIILGVAGEGKVKVATTGRVKVKVDATRGAIRVGDLLVTSEVEGVAMKSVPVDLGGTSIHRPGTIIGKALEPLEKGVGEILVLLSLQ